MGRIVTSVVVFFVALNLFSGVMIQTGLADEFNINAQTGDACADSDLESEEQACVSGLGDRYSERGVSSGSSRGDTLFGLYQTLTDGFSTVINTLLPAVGMLERLGVPLYITRDILQPLMGVLILFALLSYLPGRDV